MEEWRLLFDDHRRYNNNNNNSVDRGIRHRLSERRERKEGRRRKRWRRKGLKIDDSIQIYLIRFFLLIINSLLLLAL